MLDYGIIFILVFSAAFCLAKYGIRGTLTRPLCIISVLLSFVVILTTGYNISNIEVAPGSAVKQIAYGRLLLHAFLFPLIIYMSLRYKLIKGWPEYYRANCLINSWLKKHYCPGNLDNILINNQMVGRALRLLEQAIVAWSRGQSIKRKTRKLSSGQFIENKWTVKCPNCDEELQLVVSGKDNDFVPDCIVCGCSLSIAGSVLIASGGNVKKIPIVNVSQKILIIEVIIKQALVYRMTGDLESADSFLEEAMELTDNILSEDNDLTNYSINISWLSFLIYFYRCEISLCASCFDYASEYLRKCERLLIEMEIEQNKIVFFSFSDLIRWTDPRKARANYEILEKIHLTEKKRDV